MADESVTKSVPTARTLPLSVTRPAYSLWWTDDAGQHKQPLDGTSTVGSSTSNPIVVAERTVSRLHAQLEVRETGVWVLDLRSKNGCFVNDVAVESSAVPHGSVLRLGQAALQVTLQNEPRSVRLWGHSAFGMLAGESAAMRELFDVLARVARTEATVLIEGETGTGKELVARTIHEASARASGPFIILDCGALADSMVESELFGHTRGSFTGAIGDRAGAIESAHGGTLFLDEIAELPQTTQQKLLRALDARMVRRVGETAYRHVDVRFVAATHRNLAEMVNTGTFREDLYFRLAVVPVRVPPLRERLDDIPLLVDHFLGQWNEPPLPESVVAQLGQRPWPGNVRELRNAIDRARTFGTGAIMGRASEYGSDAALAMGYHPRREQLIERFEREYIAELMAKHGHSIAAVAAAAGLSAVHVRTLVKRHGI